MGARRNEVMRGPRRVGGAGGDLRHSRSTSPHLPLTFDLDLLPPTALHPQDPVCWS